jgi:branched-chain amino acid transport system ATP-binding protein
VEQNAMLALRVCKRVYVMDDGKNVYQGTAEEMLADDQLKQQLLGI